MKVVHVIASIDPDGGGLQAVAVRIAAAQCLLGHTVHLVSYLGKVAARDVFETIKEVPGFGNIIWHLLPGPDPMETFLSLEGRRVLRDVSQDADVFHLHGVWEPVLKCAAHVAKTAGIRYCVCPAGMLDRWSMQQKPWKKRAALKLGYRHMLDNAHFIHALNLDEANLMEPLRLKAPRKIIPNGVFVEEFVPLPERGLFRSRFEFPDDRRFVLFLSRLHYKKGLDVLAKAFRAVANVCLDVDLIIAGPDGGARTGLMSLIHDLALEDRVRVIGPIYGAAKLHALVDAACFCLPSRQEGFSVAITEALACATPVVITENCHFPEVEEADAGVIVKLDPQAVASALISVLYDPSRANEMGRNGRALVLENYTWPRIAQMTLDAYAANAHTET
ncbi:MULTISPECIES: glycosyltransferase [unclassified Rhizobium]|uniref:glycosyltransferase n=1 Tax=unclassified Rhizobium TaxID=2613769 RepID=UPI000713830F|nr:MULTISPECIES: glycosyltransferase [unclassified Rhizobium]KQT04780.1 hypothetical protein ASG50_16095 [Rhizobium sp. Leaf386]KQT05146.1 hypothetical protein ASG42_21750 [Rhizobium sp. Leaf391]KQU02132.1 hypothetical protein ASG68_28255 [Rhizobium sp. Leaf453]